MSQTEWKKDKYKIDIPSTDNRISFSQMAAQMKINADILKKEISDHTEKELAKFKLQCEVIRHEGYFQ